MNPSLQQLKDIHLPAPEAWWHLAWGWWLLCFLLMLCVLGIWLAMPRIKAYIRHYQERKAIKRDIQGELENMRTMYEENHDSLVLLRSISIFLRRVSLTVFERSESAGLIEDAWLRFLDQQWGDDVPQECFSDDINAHLLKYDAYKGEIDKDMRINIDNMLILVEKWANHVIKYHV